MNMSELELIDTVIEIATVLFALLGAFIIYHLLTRNETIMEHMGTDYHHLRAALHLFNYEPLYKNPDESKEILGPILDYLAYVCQFWYIPAVQGSHLRRNVLKAPIFTFTREGTCEEQLKKHFLDVAKKFDESRGTVRALPKGLFEFGLLLLVVLAGIIFSGVWIKLVYVPYYIQKSSFDPLIFGFYAALAFFFVLFFAFIYDLRQLGAFFMRAHVYDLLKWLFIRCLLFVDRDKSQVVKQYLKKARIAYEDYIDFDYIKNETRKESLEKAEEVAKQFLEKRRKMGKYKDEDWEKEVEWTVPRAATEVRRKLFWGLYVVFIMAFSALLISPGCPHVCSLFQSLFLLWLFVILAILVVFVLFLILFGERKPIPRWMPRRRMIIPFLESLYDCWDKIVEQHEWVKEELERDNQMKHEKISRKVEKKNKRCKDV